MQEEKQEQTEKTPGVVAKIGGAVKGVFAKIGAGIGKIVAGARGKFGKKADDEEDFEVPELYLPETTEDLVWLIRKLPIEVISPKEKRVLAGSMGFGTRLVRDVMTPKDKVTFVHENDFMGPLTLDRLYKSGLKHFPVVDTKGGVAGVLHTESLNSLEIRETDRASSYVDKQVYYMRDNYTLDQALAAFLRTNSYFFVVVNQGAQMVGLITLAGLVESLIGEVPKDEFSQDMDLMAVAKRGFGLNSYIRRTDVDAPKHDF